MPITAEQFRDIATSFEAVTQKPHFDRIAFSVHRSFATIAADQKTANLLLTPQQQEARCAIEPTIFTPVPNKWGAQGWTVITLANADELTARAALKDAWNNSHKRKK